MSEDTTKEKSDDYWTGWRDRHDSIDELHEVRKIACALIRNTGTSRAASSIAAGAWAIWRAIKAGQEDRK